MGVKKILIPVDGSKRSVDAINMVKSLFCDSELDIHLLHVVDTEYVVLSEVKDKFEKLSEDMLNKTADLVKDYKVTKASLGGNPYEEIVKYADKEKLDMIVITRTGLSGIRRYLVGSVTSKVIAGSTVPVIVVPESE